KGDIMVFPR
nr:RecName: Full=Probable auxin-binding protein [Populus euphratica]